MYPAVVLERGMEMLARNQRDFALTHKNVARHATGRMNTISNNNLHNANT